MMWATKGAAILHARSCRFASTPSAPAPGVVAPAAVIAKKPRFSVISRMYTMALRNEVNREALKDVFERLVTAATIEAR
jgi:hypothetical protein